MRQRLRRFADSFRRPDGDGSSSTVREAWLALMHREATPHAVGLGLGAGVFAAFVPVLGAQTLIAVMIAWAGRASIGAALLGTWAGNPLTWPAMWVASYLLGLALLGETGVMTVDELRWTFMRLVEAPRGGFVEWLATLTSVANVLWPILKPLFVGGLVLGLISGGALYFIGRRAAEAFTRREQQA